MSQDKQAVYRNFCRQNPNLPIFLQDWWLDLVCGENDWNAAISTDKSGTIRGVLPYYRHRRLGFTFIRKPHLTPFLGLWYLYPTKEMRPHKQYSFEDEVAQELITQLPKTAFTSIYHGHHIQNWMAFYRNGYQQTTAYTYVLSDVQDIESVFANMAGNTRSDIRKAKRQLTIEESTDISLLYDLLLQTFDRQQLKLPITLPFLKKVDQALRKQNQVCFLVAKDEQNRIHAGNYFVWDQQTMYNLMSGANTALRSSGAVPLLLWEGIQKASAQGLAFDFEGSMLEGVERVFRKFGGERKAYHRVWKDSHWIFRLLRSLKK